MYDPNDLEYGVTSNAKSYQRGVKANKHIQREVEELCEVIFWSIWIALNSAQQVIT